MLSISLQLNYFSVMSKFLFILCLHTSFIYHCTDLFLFLYFLHQAFLSGQGNVNHFEKHSWETFSFADQGEAYLPTCMWWNPVGRMNNPVNCRHPMPSLIYNYQNIFWFPIYSIPCNILIKLLRLVIPNLCCCVSTSNWLTC